MKATETLYQGKFLCNFLFFAHERANYVQKGGKIEKLLGKIIHKAHFNKKKNLNKDL